ncbi:MAG TPA: carboxypeptidase regulatory-like domain-containing protein, partial [Terriglobia bacterium]|nr:carboxypeptidase regulatory-like domain-containing protein [Terriglobia bacterium]
MRISAAIRSVWPFLLVCLFATAGLGQEKSGSLGGTASDDTNAVLPGVHVTLVNKATGRALDVTAGPYGDYSFSNVEPGHYSITFALDGFARTEFPDIDILVAQNLRLDTKLKAGATSTTIQVTDFAPPVDLQNSSVVVHIPQEEIEKLPKARTFQQLANLAPRVNTGEIEGGIQINGASGAENTFLIDGVETQSAIDGRSRQNAVFEYVQEIQIQTAGVEARYRGALGGVVSAVTR